MRASWSAKTFGFSIQLAVIYPALFLLAQWALVGHSQTLAGVAVLPEESNPIFRFFIILAFIFAAFAIPKSSSEDETQENVSVLEYVSIIIVPLVLIVSTLLAGGNNKVLIGFAAIFIAARYSGLMALTAGVIIAIFLSGQTASIIPVSIGLLIAYIYQDVLGKKHNKQLTFSIIYTALLLACVGYWLWAFGADVAEDAVLISLVCIIPLLNAIFDFISIGLTRFCLRIGEREGKPLRYGAMDLFIATIVFFTLLLTVYSFFHIVRDGDGNPIISVTDIANDPGGSPLGQAWFFLALSTTLVPTILHTLLVFVTPILRVGGLKAPLEAVFKKHQAKEFFPIIAAGLISIAIYIMVGAYLVFVMLLFWLLSRIGVDFISIMRATLDQIANWFEQTQR
ncbi:MAG: hypothetical protein Hens3KO_21670 [Henriciella sp.]